MKRGWTKKKVHAEDTMAEYRYRTRPQAAHSHRPSAITGTRSRVFKVHALFPNTPATGRGAMGETALRDGNMNARWRPHHAEEGISNLNSKLRASVADGQLCSMGRLLRE